MSRSGAYQVLTPCALSDFNKGIDLGLRLNGTYRVSIIGSRCRLVTGKDGIRWAKVLEARRHWR